MWKLVYYQLKPFLPWKLRMGVRRVFARRRRDQVGHIWPINPATAQPPAGWTGWPQGKKFAFVLTHDVEGADGLAKCRQLMELEMAAGFRSSFNFIPEGEYRVSAELRQELTRNGFEVAIHDLHHDGKLYRSRRGFAAQAARINEYVKEWGVCGFRSGFMHHNLAWLHALKVAYDASIFETDPFEPQPDGAGTIFPFWLNGALPGSGYAELPYTLPQDSTLFLVFQEKSPEIWKRKLDWVAQQGGMALVIVHPDYVAFDGQMPGAREYPSSYYREFLDYVRSRYTGAYWHALPREVSQLVHEHKWSAPRALLERVRVDSRAEVVSQQKPTVWIDLDNTPHVPFFLPIMQELEARGFPLLVTARDAFQVCELAAQKGLAFQKIGKHSGKNRVRKLAGLFVRALELVPAALARKPALAVSHGSRSQIIASNMLGIPTLLLADYEHAKTLPLMRPTWEMVPEVIPDASLCCPPARIRRYTGIKEDVYAWQFQPDTSLLRTLGLNGSELIATVRPPATEAHYHNPESEKLFVRFMDRACSTESMRVVLLPRNKKQDAWIRNQWPAWFQQGKTLIPATALDGLGLIWNSDLVVSGGGTMNREAAALGVPVYSIFRGPIGAVDRQLAQEGRLVLIESEQEVDTRIALKKREKKSLAELTSRRTLLQVVNTIEELLKTAK